ncbi:MAG: methionine--tRNA ligase subunit beta, partial [Lachnospiraceae bacterium]|nr:methionine--tRNA ligase subunit beta [Lachnospiraceae bacterium]
GCSSYAAAEACDEDLISMSSALRDKYEKAMDGYAPHDALSEIFRVIQRANKYIDETAPWVLAKDMDANGSRLAFALYNLLEAARICGVLLTPFIPSSCDKLFDSIGAASDVRTWDSAAKWGSLPESAKVEKGENLFPRIDEEKMLTELEEIEKNLKKESGTSGNEITFDPPVGDKVDFETFCKNDLRVVKVKACEAVKKSDKLLKFTLDDGTGQDRQILSGIHKWYEPETLVGKTLVAIVNLPPRKMMGLESNGMLLSAVHYENGEETLSLVMPGDNIPAGSRLC